MRITPSRVRFVLEAAFLVVVAAVCWAADLTWRGIVPAMALAWALVTFVERSATQDHTALLHRFAVWAGGPKERTATEEPQAEPAPPPSHVTVLESEPETPPEHPPTPAPEPEPPTPEPAPPAPEPEAPRPEPEQPTPQLRSVPKPPEPEGEQEQPVVARLPVDGPPREWNIWELERVARESEGEDAARDDELGFLLLELRQFANADGQLPATFDPVVRDAFGELLFTAP